jgi:predicted O-methyltransferase YrrM
MGLAYIRYRTSAKSRHGVHSPFVYNLVENVLQKIGANHSVEIEKLRAKLKSDHRSLAINDLGAGSKTTTKNTRKLSEIATHSATASSVAKLLQRLVTHYQLPNILELGTNLGLTTAYLSASPEARKTISIEGDENLVNMAREHIKSLGLTADIRTGDFKDALPKALADIGQVDFAYLDGNHQKNPTLHYFNTMIPHLQNHSVIAVGDIHWSAEMEEAWADIKNHPDVRVTADLFYVGLVFFKKELTREHFTLKFP